MRSSMAELLLLIPRFMVMLMETSWGQDLIYQIFHITQTQTYFTRERDMRSV